MTIDASREQPQSDRSSNSDRGRLRVRLERAPTVEDDQAAPFGVQQLSLDAERDALLFVPRTYQADRPAPLVVMLHGAGGNAHHGLTLLRDHAEAAGVLLLAPASFYNTWDLLVDDYGFDVNTIGKALEQVFRFYSVDLARLAIGGFSDGASYALSLGLTNGDRFTHIIAFSPGLIAPAARWGKPRIFISHGTEDDVLPIDRCSRWIAPRLEEAGCEVHYHEFAGSHTVPPTVARLALAWLLGETH
jgi:phospholipase/carboxylesterase